MKVNILSSTSFHVLPLARELQRLGADVRFYSYLPNSYTRKAGLKEGSYVSFLWLVSPLLLIYKLSSSRSMFILKLINCIMDVCCCMFMRKSDVVIALGSVYINAFKKANKEGAITILEWGSKHIIEQRKCFGISASQNRGLLKRELQSYEIVNYISIASMQVADSFTMHGINRQKLIINPYGVDLIAFPPTQLSDDEQFDLITVGGWRYEKGSDLLCELCKKYGYSLLHVGKIVNMPFPEIGNMKHVDSVPQSELTYFYSKAKVFVLPSRADGFGLVLCQAVSSGLPIVCSKETGGRDLRELIDDKQWIIEMEELTVEELKVCVDTALVLAHTQIGVRNYTDKENLTWRKYGERYFSNLKNISNCT